MSNGRLNEDRKRGCEDGTAKGERSREEKEEEEREKEEVGEEGWNGSPI